MGHYRHGGTRFTQMPGHGHEHGKQAGFTEFNLVVLRAEGPRHQPLVSALVMTGIVGKDK